MIKLDDDDTTTTREKRDVCTEDDPDTDEVNGYGVGADCCDVFYPNPPGPGAREGPRCPMPTTQYSKEQEHR